MTPMTRTRSSLAACAALLAVPAAFAQASFQSTQAAFQAASTTTLQADFEGIHREGGISDPYTEGSVTFFDPKNL